MRLRNSFYDSKKWLSVRKQALCRDKYMDRYLARYGKMINADVVHHIFPLKEYPQYAYCLWNLISVSKSTHNTFHDRATDELTDTGKEVLRRLCKKRNMEIPDKYKEKVEKKCKLKYLHWY